MAIRILAMSVTTRGYNGESQTLLLLNCLGKKNGMGKSPVIMMLQEGIITNFASSHSIFQNTIWLFNIAMENHL